MSAIIEKLREAKLLLYFVGLIIIGLLYAATFIIKADSISSQVNKNTKTIEQIKLDIQDIKNLKENMESLSKTLERVNEKFNDEFLELYKNQLNKRSR